MPGAFGLRLGSGLIRAGSIVTSPIIFSNIGFVIKPGLSIAGISPVKSTMVDSIPMPTAPPSRIMSIRPVISSAT